MRREANIDGRAGRPAGPARFSPEPERKAPERSFAEALRRAGQGHELLPTPLRERVFTFLREEARPLGAYEIAKALSGTGTRTHPNSVYRVLEVFEQVGLVLPVASLKRYIVSPDPHAREWTLLACTGCGEVTAVRDPAGPATLHALCRERGFRARSLVMECLGECGNCQG